MTLLSIELSDFGIIAAGGSPIQILPVEGDSLSSPGYAVQANRQLVVGRAEVPRRDARNPQTERARLEPVPQIRAGLQTFPFCAGPRPSGLRKVQRQPSGDEQKPRRPGTHRHQYNWCS